MEEMEALSVSSWTRKWSSSSCTISRLSNPSPLRGLQKLYTVRSGIVVKMKSKTSFPGWSEFSSVIIWTGVMPNSAATFLKSPRPNLFFLPRSVVILYVVSISNSLRRLCPEKEIETERIVLNTKTGQLAWLQQTPFRHSCCSNYAPGCLLFLNKTQTNRAT